jgi:cell division protein FtsW
MSVSGLTMLARKSGNHRLMMDSWLAMAVVTLLLFGVVMVYSASISLAQKTTGNDAYYLARHLLHLSTALIAMTLVMRIRLSVFERSGPFLLLVGLGLLVAVLLPGVGTTINGSTRWLHFGLLNIQPSELMKFFMLIYVSGYLVRKEELLSSFTQGVLIIGVVLAVTGMLLLAEPDLGTLVVMSLATIALMFLAGVRFRYFLMILVVATSAVVLLTIISPYRLERVTGFLNPWADPFDSGFQLVQALIAFGRGEWFGVGLGASIQKLFYLPAAHTDFVLAVIAEELGLVGVWFIILLFGIVIHRGFHIARRAEANGLLYGARVAQGSALLLGIQAMINMGVNMGVLPTKGLTLPFISAGGSSLIVSCCLVGLMFRVDYETRLQDWGER